MFVENVINCNFSKWYSKFNHLTIESKIIDFPKGFKDYLLSDGIVLPKSIENEEICEGFDDEDEEEGLIAPEFPDFQNEIKNAIEELGGKVFPKLNWSSPKDSSWIKSDGCVCRSVSDVFLLLKSSNFIVHDLTEPFELCEDKENSNPLIRHQLILRKWVDINPSTEFRCFVSEGKLIGISQREASAFYSYIGKTKNEIKEDIKTFYQQNINNKFFDNSYIFDVYRSRRNQVDLLDFNPFGEVTDSLLYDWEELINSSKEFDFRFVNDKLGIQPNSYKTYSVPLDFTTSTNTSDVVSMFLQDSTVSYS